MVLRKRKDPGGGWVGAGSVWALYFLFLWQVLLTAQNPGLMADDSGEMAASARNLGLPHPPGYPLFNLLGYFATLLPVGTIAFRLNLFSALLVLASLALTLRTCREMGKGRPWSASRPGWMLLASIGILFLSGRNLFAQCLTAKGCIYALNLLFLSAVFWLRTRDPAPRLSQKFLLGLLLLWAVGMGNHWQTQVLWIPFILLWIHRSRAIRSIKALVHGLTLVLVGLSLYLYLPFRAASGCQPCWGDPTTWKGFWWVVSRRLVQETETWLQPTSFYLHSFQWIFRTAIDHWFPGSLLLAFAGSLFFWRKDRELFHSLASLGLPLLAGIALVHEEKNQYLVPVYLVALAGVAAILCFWGAGWVLEKLSRKRDLIFLTALAAASTLWLFHVRDLEDKSRYALAEDFGTNVLKGLPKNPLLLADGDHYVMSIWYHQFAQGKRPDVIFQPSVFLYHNWGWAQLAKRAPDLHDPIYSTPLFTGRIKALTDQAARHPLHYSLGREYLEPVLEQVPGFWVPRGLTFDWRPARSKAGNIVDGVKDAMAFQRVRGLEFLDGDLDPSNRQILRYYTSQPNVALSYIQKTP